MPAATSLDDPARVPLPGWIRTRPPQGAQYAGVRDLLHELHLSTVCREARCPNLGECWSAGAATIMLLGSACSRRCGFCAVETRWSRGVVDETEPERVAEAVRRWGLRYVVLTQVCRDDLEDGGAGLLGRTVGAIRRESPTTLVELLIGDLAGREESIRTVLDDPPDVLAHNLETVRELSDHIRDRRAGYDRSLGVLRTARSLGGARLVTKSSIMLGLGEASDAVHRALADLRGAGVDLVTFGQYLRPTPTHLPVDRYIPPDEFDAWRDAALACGFAGAVAGPLVRSSYHAEELYRSAMARHGE